MAHGLVRVRPERFIYSAAMSDRFFTSESVTEGHPDKLADRISDGVLDAVLTKDPEARVACETLVTTGLVVIAGELKTTAQMDYEPIARQVIRDVGYDGFDPHFAADQVVIQNVSHQQSPDIAEGVSASLENRLGSSDPLDLLGAGDQGLMFGFATNETDSLMPLPIDAAHQLARRLTTVRKTGEVPFFRPDGKTQVTVRYVDGVPVEITRVLVSTQHVPEVSNEEIEEAVRTAVVEPTLDHWLAPDYRLTVNPSGRFVIGGPHGDAGLTGRKIIVDTYGGFARHGGGAFSGKDPSKVDRSATYAARYAAKNVVAAGLADRCEIQVSYAIGQAHPFSVLVDCFGTETVDPTLLTELVGEFFDLRPAAIIERLDLKRPIYGPTAAYGHFGRAEFSWESTDEADRLAKAAADL